MKQRNAQFVLVAMTLANAMILVDQTAVPLALPNIMKSFHEGTALVQWVLTASLLPLSALLVFGGRLGDLVGLRRVFLVGAVLFAGASAVGGFAPSLEVLLAARVLQGIGGALMLPTSLGLMLPEFGPHERHVAIGVWAATGGIAAASGPPLGGLLVQADWRLVFLVNVPVGLLGLGFGLRTLAERREPNAARPDVAGALALMLAVGALVVAIVKGQEWGWGSAEVVALLLVAAVLLPAIWWRSERHEAPIVEPSMLRVRTFGLAVGASLLFFAGFGAMLLSGVLFLTGVWHESVVTAGLMLFPGPAMATAFSIPSARLGARFGYRLPGVVGALAFAAGSVWFILRTGNQPEFLTQYLPGQILTGAGVGLMIPTLTGAGASSLAPERFATGAAVLTMGRQIGVALGVAVLVAVLGTNATSASDFHTAWLIVVAGGLAAGLALAAIGPPALNAAGAGGPARPVISEPIADPVIVEPLIAEEAA